MYNRLEVGQEVKFTDCGIIREVIEPSIVGEAAHYVVQTNYGLTTVYASAFIDEFNTCGK